MSGVHGTGLGSPRNGIPVDDVQRLEAERLRPSPHDLDPLDELFRRLIGLIAAECRRAGMLP